MVGISYTRPPLVEGSDIVLLNQQAPGLEPQPWAYFDAGGTETTGFLFRNAQSDYAVAFLGHEELRLGASAAE
jgi:hypothetical protein